MHLNCSVCEKIDPSLSNYENADLIGTSEASIRRHKAATGNPQGKHAAVDPAPDLFDVPAEIITQRRRTIRMEDGSWERITYRPQDLAKIELRKNAREDLEASIAAWRPIYEVIDNGGTLVVHPSDLQTGKAKEAGGGTPELKERFANSMNAILGIIERDAPSEIIVIDNGDIIENFDNVGNQAQTNDLYLTEQVRTARRLIAGLLQAVAARVQNVVYISVPSNHCQVRAKGSKDLASVPEDDWGIEINYQLEDQFAMNPELANSITFVRPTPGEEAVTVTTQDGTIIGAVHGHQFAPTKAHDWWAGQSHGRRSGLDRADILTFGHYHTLSVAQSGNKRWLLGVTSSDGGSGWFANKTGSTAIAGMTTYTVAYGRPYGIDIV